MHTHLLIQHCNPSVQFWPASQLCYHFTSPLLHFYNNLHTQHGIFYHSVQQPYCWSMNFPFPLDCSRQLTLLFGTLPSNACTYAHTHIVNSTQTRHLASWIMCTIKSWNMSDLNSDVQHYKWPFISLFGNIFKTCFSLLFQVMWHYHNWELAQPIRLFTLLFVSTTRFPTSVCPAISLFFFLILLIELRNFHKIFVLSLSLHHRLSSCQWICN